MEERTEAGRTEDKRAGVDVRWDNSQNNVHAPETKDDLPAPALPLPDVSLVCIQYPGLVKNTDRALSTLKGEATVSKVRSFPLVQINKQTITIGFQREEGILGASISAGGCVLPPDIRGLHPCIQSITQSDSKETKPFKPD